MNKKLEDYHPVFHEVSGDWRERWMLIRKFIVAWYGREGYLQRDKIEINSDFPHGLHPVETWDAVKETEQRLKFELPPALKEWDSLFQQTNSRYYNLFRDDHAMLWMDDGESLVIRVICEGNVAWGVHRKDLELDDPPVQEMKLVSFGDDDDSWFGSTWTAFGGTNHSTNHTVTEWMIKQIQWYLSGKTKINVSMPNEATSRQRLLKDMEDEFDRRSKFGQYFIFESTNRFAVTSNVGRANQMEVIFATQPDFSTLPDWIVENTSDHRVSGKS